MIVFLIFAPIEFMGGTEKWINITAKNLNKNESTQIISVHPSISNLYGRIVAKRKYESRANASEIHNHLYLEYYTFIPFTRKWKSARKTLLDARLIYIKFEVLEVLIILYFLGISGFKKTIAGLHTPFVYYSPLGLLDHIHNYVYQSRICGYFMKKMLYVHIMVKRDQKFIKNKFRLTNVKLVPITSDIFIENNKISSIDKNVLNIIFVGELNMRKGIDTLISIIQESFKNYIFHIAGDGPMRDDIIKVTKNYSNVKYYGFLNKHELSKLYLSGDVFLFPSRAETTGLVMIEAMFCGLPIINSKEISLSLPRFIETSIASRNSRDYIKELQKIYKLKLKNKNYRKEITKYAFRYYSAKRLNLKFKNEIFGIK